MNGDGFTPYVKEGEDVKAGQKLLHFDRQKIEAAGHPDMVVVLLTNSEDMENFRVNL
jgi:PTS system sucrose-specific IIC component